MITLVVAQQDNSVAAESLECLRTNEIHNLCDELEARGGMLLANDWKLLPLVAAGMITEIGSVVVCLDQSDNQVAQIVKGLFPGQRSFYSVGEASFPGFQKVTVDELLATI